MVLESTRALLSRVQSFRYGSVIYGSILGDFTEGSTLFKLSNIPRTTADGVRLFPALTKAQLKFNTYPHDLRLVTPPDESNLSQCFLTDVNHLFLDEIVVGESKNLAHALNMLGLKCMTAVNVTYALSAGVPPRRVIPEALQVSSQVRTVVIDIQDFLDYHLSLPYAEESYEDLIWEIRETFPYFRTYVDSLDAWDELEQVVLLLGKHQLDKFIQSLRMQIAFDKSWDLRNKEFVRKKVYYKIRNSPTAPQKVFPERDVKRFLGLKARTRNNPVELHE